MGKKKECIFKITQYQPNDEVTSSSIMVEVDGLKILMDLGLSQDSCSTFPQLYHKNMQKIQSIPFDELDYLIIQHSHYDHCMYAIAYANGFNGITIATELTTELSKINMEDAYSINNKDISRYGADKYKHYFKLEDIDMAIENTRCYNYDQKIKLSNHVTLELLSACHLSGASMSYLTYQDEHQTKHLLYTSDITFGHKQSRPFTMRIKDRKLKVDVLIMEATYGLRDREVFDESISTIKYLEDVILKEVVGKNQILFIPSFAIHRSTEIYYYLNEAFKNPKIKEANVPVYFCGKLMEKAHRIIGKRENFCYYDEEWQDKREIWETQPFGFITNVHGDLDNFCKNNSRKIVVSSSGMMNQGMSALLSKYYIPNKKVTILSCGYMAENSLGWQIKQRQESVVLNGEKLTNRCFYHSQIPHLSGHANHQGLIDFVKSLNQTVLKDVILVHGTDKAKQELKEDLEKEISSNKNIHIIKQFQTLKF